MGFTITGLSVSLESHINYNIFNFLGGGDHHHQQRRGAAGPSGNGLGGQTLLVPNARARGSSLPGNMEVVNQDDIYRLRNFSMAGKKIVNRGDSVKARSRSSLASTCSRLVTQWFFDPKNIYNKMNTFRNCNTCTGETCTNF